MLQTFNPLNPLSIPTWRKKKKNYRQEVKASKSDAEIKKFKSHF